jgi:alkylation response protein AidB-like acyl-CoA dehydrogenase
MGLRASSTAELVFEDCRVPGRNLLGSVGEGFRIAMHALDNGRFGIASACVGCAQASIDAAVKYAQAREQFGRQIGTFQLIQEMIADMVVETEAARLLVWRTACLKDKGDLAVQEVSIAKYFASEAAIRAANRAIQVHGGYGFIDEYPVERYLRDVRVTTLYEGTSEMQKLIIARNATGLSAFGH